MFDKLSLHGEYYEEAYGHFHRPALIIGGSFALFSLVLSIVLIYRHLSSYTNPAEQKWIVGILFMVPVYASDSIISLWNPTFTTACEILRSCYEAFALYCFGSYLVACLGGGERVARLLECESQNQLKKPLLHSADNIGESRKTSFLNFFLQPRALGRELFTIINFGIVQYMILKIFCAFLQLVLELCGVYGDGEFKWYYGYPFIAAVLNFSQMWALFCLVQFYNATHERLQPIRPLAKFISFKAIVFATWWQGVGIAILCYFGVLPKRGKFQKGLQDFLICIEMAIAAVAHVYVFSAEPYQCLPASEHGKVTTETTKSALKLEEDGKGKPAIVEQTETKVEAPGTSVVESVQDVVLGGGEHVVKDVVLTITQVIEPVEKGVTMIKEKFHQKSVRSSIEEGEGGKLEIEEHVEEDVMESGAKIEIQEHAEEKVTKSGANLEIKETESFERMMSAESSFESDYYFSDESPTCK